MDTHTSDQLSHEEAFDLLPWHINATLDESLSEQVAEHVEHCMACQEESAILSNTIVALNTGDTATTSLDTRFSQVLERVHDYERSSAPNAARGASIGERVAAWLGLPMARVQWAGAFALGLAVGVGILLATLQSDGVDTLSPPAYQTHSSVEAPLRLRLEFDRAPSAAELTNLKRSVTASANWQEVSETGFLIELPDELTVGAVTDIRSRLLANDSVVSVDIAIDNVSSE